MARGGSARTARAHPAVVEPVSVGLIFKRRATFVMARTMTRWVSLSIKLPRVVTDSTLDRNVQQYAAVYHHVCNLRTADDLVPLLALIDEAYEADG